MTNLHNHPLLNQRRAGVLLHVSSLPSKFYVGDMGKEALQFVDFLHDVGASVWQTLPINMPHADNSPYQCLSAHAGNPDFISLEALQAQSLLTKEDLSGLITSKTHLLAKAYFAFIQEADNKMQQSFKRFCKKQAHWLDDLSVLAVLSLI